MKNGIIATVKGGYDKKDVLAKVDAFMSLLMKIQEGISPAEAKEALDEIRKMPLNTVEKDVEGFAKIDTNGYFAQFEYNIIAYFKQP